VIENVGRNETASAKRRNHKHRHAKSETDGAGDWRIADGAGGRNGCSSDELTGSANGGSWRRNMIEEAAVLVEGQEEHRLGPNGGVGHQGTQDEGQNIFAEDRWSRWMVGGDDGTDEPGDLWKISRGDVGQEVGGEDGAEGMLVQGRSRILVILEVGKHVIGEDSAENGFIGRGIDSPGDAASLKLFGHGGVGQATGECVSIGDDGFENGSTVFAVRVQGSGHGVETIGVGGSNHGTEVVVADGEGIGERVIEGNVAAVVVAHGEGGVVWVGGEAGGDKTVHGASVPALMLRAPIMRDVMGASCIGCRCVQMKWKELADGGTVGVGGIRLLKSQTLIGEAANATIAAKVVVEGTIFLNEDDHVLNIGQLRTRGNRGGRSGRTATATVQSRRCQFSNGRYGA